ncbi:MAG: ATP-binding protein [bacterium]
MNLKDIWTIIEEVPLTASMHEVFDLFRAHRDWPFLPVVDEDRRVVGVVREYDLKAHAYAQFGRDLVKRHQLKEYVKPTLVLPVNVTPKELLDSSAQNTNPDGIVLTEDGKYRAVLLNRAVLSLFEQQHLESEVRLVQAQKMEAIGTLAGGIAHDLNNILTPILGYTELMTYMLKTGEPIEQDIVDQIVVSAMRAREIVKQILGFSRHQKDERCPLNMCSVIKEALPLIRSSLPTTIDIEMQLNVDDCMIMANADEMHRVLLNLCTNAYHAMRARGGRLQITLDDHKGPVLGWCMHDELLLGDYLRLSVSDTGTGIEPDMLPRLFEPFFTTKKQGEGTGLGLPIVHGIVSRCKGVISIESAIGKGSTFHLYLPLLLEGRKADSTVRRNHPASPEDSHATGLKTRILFVDDEFAVTRLAAMILPKFGISVVTENDSRKALSLFRGNVSAFDLLVTDQTMPGITGLNLAKEVMRISPGFPVIMCTGYSDEVSPDQAREAGIRDYLLKPPDFQQLAASIHQHRFPWGQNTQWNSSGLGEDQGPCSAPG